VSPTSDLPPLGQLLSTRGQYESELDIDVGYGSDGLDGRTERIMAYGYRYGSNGDRNFLSLPDSNEANADGKEFMLSHVVIHDYEPKHKFLAISDDTQHPALSLTQEDAEIINHSLVIDYGAYAEREKKRGILSLELHKFRRAPELDKGCATCSGPLEGNIFRRGRFCHYTGKHYCKKCHSDDKALIPAKVVKEWDHKLYAVSKTSYNTLISHLKDPLINLRTECPALYTQLFSLRKVKELRTQAIMIAQFLRSCRDAIKLLQPVRNCMHLVDCVHIYSIHDLHEIYRSKLAPRLARYLRACLHHVTVTCESCKGKGYYCELCKSNELLFAFQTIKITKCKVCNVVYHQTCATNHGLNTRYEDGVNVGCPRCTRLNNLRKTRTITPGVTTGGIGYEDEDRG